MSSSGSFYDKKRIGKARALAASLSEDAAGELLRHLDQASGDKPDVAALVREAESADAARGGARAEDTDAVVTPDLASIPFSTLTDDAASSREMAAAHATRRRSGDATSSEYEGTQASGAQAPLLQELGYGSDHPSLKIPFLVVGAVIVAALGIPSMRRVSAPSVVNDARPAAVAAATAGRSTAGESAVSSDANDASIRSVVASYADAYTRRSEGDVRAVYPGVDAVALRTSFGGVAQQQIEVFGVQVHVAGPRATVECAWRTTGQASNGSAFVTESPVVLTLDQRDGRWFIVNRY